MMKRLPFLFLGIHSEAIGHFSRETEILFDLIETHRNLGKLSPKTRILLCAQYRISNRFLMNCISDSFRAIKWPYGKLLMKIFNRLSRSHRKMNFELSKRGNSYLVDIHKGESKIFNNERLEQIAKHLELHRDEIGNKEYVVLAVRDNGYDEQVKKENNPKSQRYRNHDPIFFNSCVLLLESLGYRIVRLGRNNTNLFKSYYPQVLEISELDCDENDICDFAIISGAKWVISTGTGIDDIGMLLRKPMIYLGVAPMGDIPQSHLFRGILGSDYHDADGHKLSLQDLINRGLYCSNPASEIESGNIQVNCKDPKTLVDYLSFIMGSGVSSSAERLAELFAKEYSLESLGKVVY